MTFHLEDTIALLTRTPSTFHSLLTNLPDAWLSADEGPNTFTPYEIVGHLVHGERTDWMARAQLILAQGADRTFTPYDRFAQRHESEGKSLATLLDEFADLRAHNLTKLRSWNLTDRELDLEGVHPTFGPVTLRQLLATWVAHDLSHLAQAARVMAKRHRDDVGPWRAFLPILDR